jgi:predicted ATPase/DNA-binding winged helix-turn-helix (wHTH) protein
LQNRIPDPDGVGVAFGPFIFSPFERLLLRDDVPVEIGGRAFALLQALVEAPGRVVSKRELMLQAWPDVQVEDGSLRFHMAGLRKALQDGVYGARYIDTQVGAGYALVVPVRRIVGDATERRPVEAVAWREDLTDAERLPARLTRLIGREEEKRLLADRIVDAKLVTIVGAAGIGKTTLAAELAHTLLPAFANRVYFVDLAALESGDLLGSAIANALGITVQAEDPTAVVLGNLRNRRLMLVLGNCEHLIGYVCAFVERIGEVAAAVTVLATSREPLRAWGEQVHWLGPLDFPDDPSGLSAETLLSFSAIELFVTRARAANGSMAVNVDSLRRIARLCRQVEGMALPIELTAMHAARHGLESTAALLGERFSLGLTGRRTARPRQQTLQATLDWSYDLLGEAERRTLESVSVFVGSFSLQAALSVIASAAIELELRTALGLSLMFTRSNVEAVGTELLRAYHLAVDLNDHRAQLRMLGRLHIYHERIGDFAVARDWACKALDAASVIDEPEAHSVAASLFGISCHLAGDQGEAQAYLERAARDALPSQRLRTIHYGFDHRNRSVIALSRAGRHTEAIEVIDNTIERCVGNGEHIYTPNLLRIKAEALMRAGGNNRQAAGRLLEDALAWSRKQRARAWELRAALAFVRLEREAAGSARALEILRSLRESFDEGLDTADLRAAEALLAGSPELIVGE